MKWFRHMFDGLAGRPTTFEEQGPASRLTLIAMMLLTAALCAALFGLGIGSTAIGLAVANIVKVPLVVVLSGLFALPAAIIVLRVLGSPIRATDLWLSQANGTLATALVLASTAPLVALFYHSSNGLSGIVAQVVIFIAIAFGLYVFVRALMERKPERKRALAPVMTLVILQLLAAIQLVGLASPMLPEVTPFSEGADGLIQRL